MDHLREEREDREMRELLLELLKVQQRILHRLEKLEEKLVPPQNP